MKKLITLLSALHIVFFGFCQPMSIKDVVFPDERKINKDFYFGMSMAGVEGFAVVGAPGANDTGKVYLYHKVGNDWLHLANLTGSNLGNGDGFGYQLAMDSNTVFVACEASNGPKPIYVFEKPQTGWTDMTETALLHASDSTLNDYFGQAMVVQNNHLFVGAPGAKHNGGTRGAVYLFIKNGSSWVSASEDRKITTSVTGIANEFGYEVAVFDNHLLVGAPNDASNNRKGKAYLFEKNGTWTQPFNGHVEFTGSNSDAGDRFGHALDIHGSDIVIGAPYFDGQATKSGMVYQFSKPAIGPWVNATESQTLNPPQMWGSYPQQYGEIVRLREDVAFIGVPNDRLYYGSIFIHNKEVSGWNSSANSNLNDPSSSFHDFLGRSFLALENEVLAGAPGEDFENSNEGVLKVFTKTNANWDGWYSTSTVMAPPYLGFEDEKFGESVDLEGDISVIGASGHSRDHGIAYIKHFNGSTWSTLAKLLPSDPQQGAKFGKIVKISGDWIAVVSEREGTTPAKIYLYKKPATGWADATETAQIHFTPSGLTYLSDIDLDDELLVVTSESQEAAFIYTKGTGDWTSNHQPIATLTPSNLTGYSGFGIDVKIEGDVIVIPNPYQDVPGNDEAGTIYVYEKPSTGWASSTETAQLTLSNSQESHRMGISIDIEGDVIVAGSPFMSSIASNINTGAVVVFQKPGPNWTNMNETARLDQEEALWSYRLGTDVAVANGVIYASSPWSRSPNSPQTNGAIALFDKGNQATWSNSFEIGLAYANPTLSTYSNMGHSIVAEGDHILSGALYHDSLGHYTGLVYYFETCFSRSLSADTACFEYTWIDGMTYTSTPTETLKHVLTNANGCDSVVELNLTILEVNASALADADTLIGFPLGHQYALIDCDDNNNQITPFSTANKFVIDQNGNYAIMVQTEDCIEMSDCIEMEVEVIDDLGLPEQQKGLIELFPNPSDGNIRIQTKSSPIEEIHVLNTSGAMVFSEKQINTNEYTGSFNLAAGLYSITVIQKDGSKITLKHIIQ